MKLIPYVIMEPFSFRNGFCRKPCKRHKKSNVERCVCESPCRPSGP